jgi:6-phospho-beta-glucosidase
MKAAVVGAGSTYTPELVEGILARRDALPVTELAFHDVDPGRLAILTGMAERMVRQVGSDLTVSSTTNLVRAVSDAQFVVLQLRVGQSGARVRDETIAAELGLLGQETTGLGGFAKALRTIPVVRGIAETVRAHAAPDAWIVDFTNPVGIVTRVLLDDGHRVLGVCNVANSFRRLFARMLGCTREDVTIDHAGLNHLTWTRSIKVGGIERIHEVLRGPLLTEVAGQIGIPASAVSDMGCVPSYYLKYFYDTSAAVDAQHDAPRGHEVVEVERQLLRLYADPSTSAKPALLGERGGSFYSEVAASLMQSLYTGDDELHYVNVRNQGAIPDLPDSTVVEVPSIIGQGGAATTAVQVMPADAIALMRTVAAFEELTIEAARNGDITSAHRALAVHPLIGDADLAPLVLDRLRASDPAIDGLFRHSPR